MSASIAHLLVHEITVERSTGHTATGPTYGPPEVLAAFVDANPRKVRATDARTVLSARTVYVELDDDVRLGDRVSIDGAPARVIDVKRRDGGGLPTPDHIEIVCE